MNYRDVNPFRATGLLILLLAGCGGQPVSKDGPPDEPFDPDSVQDAIPREEPRARYGNPKSYVVYGRTYHTLNSAEGYSEKGIASWYGRHFHGRLTSSREPYDMYAMTAAHRSLPLPTYVRVTHLGNGRSVVVRVNDRGPFHDNRIIDLSYAAASKLGMLKQGTAPVEVVVLNPARPTPPATPSSAQPPTDGTTPTMYLQVGAFGDPNNARRLRDRLSGALGMNVVIQPFSKDAQTLQRVRIGPLQSVGQADRVMLQLRELGLDKAHMAFE